MRPLSFVSEISALLGGLLARGDAILAGAMSLCLVAGAMPALGGTQPRGGAQAAPLASAAPPADPVSPAAVAAPAATAAEVDVKILVTPPSAPITPGARGETRLLLSPPQGIKINRFPPVTLKLQAPQGISLDATELKQGASEPIENPDDFPFKTIEPMKIGFSVDRAAPLGKAHVSGKINFVYCIARSGYCERTTRDVGFDVTVAPTRAN